MDGLNERYCAFWNCDVLPYVFMNYTFCENLIKLNHVAAVNKDEMTEE